MENPKDSDGVAAKPDESKKPTAKQTQPTAPVAREDKRFCTLSLRRIMGAPNVDPAGCARKDCTMIHLGKDSTRYDADTLKGKIEQYVRNEEDVFFMLEQLKEGTPFAKKYLKN